MSEPSAYLTHPPLTTREREILKLAREGLAMEFDGPDSDSKAPEVLFARGAALRRIIQVLEAR